MSAEIPSKERTVASDPLTLADKRKSNEANTRRPLGNAEFLQVCERLSTLEQQLTHLAQLVQAHGHECHATVEPDDG